MSRWDCARCQWAPDADALDGDGKPVRPREQLAEHALTAGHPTCPCCHRSADPTDLPFGCEACLTHARRLLSEIVTLYEMLPAELARLRSGLGQYGGSGNPYGSLPGGDVLALYGPGGTGLTGRRLRPSELAAGLEHNLDGREHLVDNDDADPPSVPFALMQWEDDWRHTHGDPASPVAGSSLRVLHAAAGYLEVHARWAAAEHAAFPEFLADLARLHRALERAIGDALGAEKANADCFDCGGRLVRATESVTITQWWIPGRIGPMPAVRRREGEIHTQDVVCERCHRRYAPTEYALALRAAWHGGLEGWVTFADAAAFTKRSVETFESWAKRGQLEVACRLSDRKRIVWWPSLQERISQSRPRRKTA